MPDVPRKDWQWAKFPKTTHVKAKKNATKTWPHRTLQTACEWLFKPFTVFSIDSWIYRLYGQGNQHERYCPHCNKVRLTGGEAKSMSEHFTGLPDMDLKTPLDDRFYLGLNIDFKVGRDKLHGKQKTRSKELPWTIIRTYPEAEALRKDFEKTAAKLKEVLNAE